MHLFTSYDFGFHCVSRVQAKIPFRFQDVNIARPAYPAIPLPEPVPKVCAIITV